MLEVILSRSASALLAMLMLALSPVIVGAQPASTCELAPDFWPLREVVGADVVGDCSGEPSETAAGDLAQGTTRGQLTRRAADGVTMFSNETTTWLDGPEGIQTRANSDRLAWEPRPESPVAPDPSPAAGPSSPPEPASKLTPTLKARCKEIVASTPNRGGPTLDQQIGMCEQLGEEYGAPGVDCYAEATRKNASTIGKISTETHNALFDATLTVCKASIR